MKKSSVILFLVFILTGCVYYIYARDFGATGNAVATQEHVIMRVLDGDTVELENGEKVRLLGINTPEKKTFFANESMSFTNQILNKTVLVESVEKDKYGRNLGYVFYKDELFNEEILRGGFAHIFIYTDDKYSDRLRKAEEEARQNEIGIWKKSPKFGCISIIEFKYLDIKESDNETLRLRNDCETMNVLIKDDATHMYKEALKNGIFEMQTQNIWNDDGDTLFIWDEKGLLMFDRY